MPSLKELRTRIRSIGSTTQITKAMQLVAASKLRRAEEVALLGKTYEEQLQAMLADVPQEAIRQHSWFRSVQEMASFQPARTLVVLMTSDRGLAGGFNLFVLRRLAELLNERQEVQVVAIGRKGQEAAARAGLKLLAAFPVPGTRPQSRDVSPIARVVLDQWQSGACDEVVVLGTRYRSISQQTVQLTRVLPLERSKSGGAEMALIEPNAMALLDALLKERVRAVIFQFLLESMAAEQASRMLAMQSATENASNIMEEIELSYHGLRKNKITAELAEIVGGSEAIVGN